MGDKVLISCRDKECRESLYSFFSRLDVNPKTNWATEDLLLEILERDYHLLIADLEKADFDGFKLVKIIRKIRPKMSLAVISDNSSKEFGGRILQEGVVYFTLKPANAFALYRAVKHHL